MKRSVTDEYAELMHYTSAAGLTGILSSQCLWATHTSHLNDMEETSLFFNERLPTIAQNLWEERKSNGLFTNVPEFDLQFLINSVCLAVKNTTLKFNEPYIFSMCGTADCRTSEHGLLSQWRAYGRHGGYAIVFDSKGIQAMLENESSRFHYQHMQWGDVFYNDPVLSEQKAEPEITEAEKIISACILKFLTGEPEKAMEETYQAVTTLSTLYKHWGFQEEREVRVVAIPMHHSIRVHAEQAEKKIKQPKAYVREGSPVPYIELANIDDKGQQISLPIKRVIVGPHRNKAQRKKAVQLLLAELDIKADVFISEIPFTGC